MIFKFFYAFQIFQTFFCFRIQDIINSIFKTSMYDNLNFLINALICIKDILEGYTPKWLTVISGFTGKLYFLYGSLCLRFSGMHLYSFHNQINVKFILMSNAVA